MKIIGSVKEDLASEKRVSITPETVKKLIDLNFSVLLEKSYAEHLGIADEEYKNKGASLESSAKEVLEKSEIILKVNCPSNDEINSIKNKSILIGQFDPISNKEMINKMIKKDVKIFSLNSTSKNYKSTIDGCFVVPGKFSRLSCSYRVG